MRNTTILIIALVLAFATTSCAGEVTESDEYQDVERDMAAVEEGLADVEARLATVTAERDALAEEVGQPSGGIDDLCAAAAAERYEKSNATQEVITAIIDDPSVYGTEEEVLDLLDELAAPDTVFTDTAFGSIGWRQGWSNTLFGGRDATIQTWTRWLSDDGSMGGSLWTWVGTATNGELFELPGISLLTYNEDGLETSQTVYYPLEDADVQNIFYSGG